MFEVNPRQGIVVWVYSMKQIKNLRRFGTVYYSSRKMKYVYLYTNASQASEVVDKIRKLHFVRSVVLSQRPMLDMDFAGRVGKMADEEQGTKNQTLITTKTENDAEDAS